jgi:hypothetical protein
MLLEEELELRQIPLQTSEGDLLFLVGVVSGHWRVLELQGDAGVRVVDLGQSDHAAVGLALVALDRLGEVGQIGLVVAYQLAEHEFGPLLVHVPERRLHVDRASECAHAFSSSACCVVREL